MADMEAPVDAVQGKPPTPTPFSGDMDSTNEPAMIEVSLDNDTGDSKVIDSLPPVDPNAVDDSIIHSGFIFKQGRRIKSWKSRWFTLRKDGRLTYYKTPKSTSCVGWVNMKAVSAVFPGGRCREVSWYIAANRACCFAIKTLNRGVYLFTENEAELQRWLTALRRVTPLCVSIPTLQQIRDSWPKVGDSTEPARRLRVSLQAGGELSPAVDIPLKPTVEEFVQAATQMLGVEVTRIFTRDGAQILEYGLLRDDDQVVVTSGEDFDARCMQLGEQELAVFLHTVNGITLESVPSTSEGNRESIASIPPEKPPRDRTDTSTGC